MSQHTSDQQREAVRTLLARLTPQEVVSTGVAALRRWWTTRPADWTDVFSVHGDFGTHFVTLLGETLQIEVDAHLWKEPFLYDRAEPWLQEVAEFLYWLGQAGLAIPLFDDCRSTGGYPVRLRVTRAGARLLSGEAGDELLPGALQRMKERCPSIPDDVLAHLTDSRACLDHALVRPAVVLLGLAYETAIEHLVQALVSAGTIGQVLNQKAAKRLASVRRLIDQQKDSEEKFSALLAWDFADILRRRRNDGAHSRPAYGFGDLAEAQELFASALRHLPFLWSQTPPTGVPTSSRVNSRS